MTPPLPGTTLSTPSGMPASAASSARRSTLREVWRAGLTTTLLPVARIGPSFQARHLDREIPRQDGADHAQRFAHDHRHVARAGGRDLLVYLVDRLGVPAEAMHRVGHVDRHAVGDRLAGVQAVQQRQFAEVLLEQVGEAAAGRACVRRASVWTRRPASKERRAAFTARSTSAAIARRRSAPAAGRWPG